MCFDPLRHCRLLGVRLIFTHRLRGNIYRFDNILCSSVLKQYQRPVRDLCISYGSDINVYYTRGSDATVMDHEIRECESTQVRVFQDVCAFRCRMKDKDMSIGSFLDILTDTSSVIIVLRKAGTVLRDVDAVTTHRSMVPFHSFPIPVIEPMSLLTVHYTTSRISLFM